MTKFSLILKPFINKKFLIRYRSFSWIFFGCIVIFRGSIRFLLKILIHPSLGLSIFIHTTLFSFSTIYDDLTLAKTLKFSTIIPRLSYIPKIFSPFSTLIFLSTRLNVIWKSQTFSSTLKSFVSTRIILKFSFLYSILLKYLLL